MDDGLLIRPQLLAAGITDEEIDACRRGGVWESVRPGSYLSTERWRELDQAQRHLLLITATAPKLGERSVVSHLSAAVLRGYAVWQPGALLDRVHVLRGASSGGYRAGCVHAHPGSVETGAIDLINGIPVTSAPRTVIDCALILPLDSGLAVADQAVRRGHTTRSELVEYAAALGPRPGRSRARRVAELVDGRSESVGESISRATMWECGLEMPELQFEIVRNGRLIARTDFAWKGRRTVGEFDGKIKYGRLLKPGEHPGEVVWREKRREDAVREESLEVVRWCLPDLANRTAFADQIRAAWARGARFR